MIPEDYGGLGESLLTYALCVEELARGWMSKACPGQHPPIVAVHDPAARYRGAEALPPDQDGHG